MKIRSGALLAAASFAAVQLLPASAQGARLLYYTFETGAATNGAAVPNLGTTGTAGSIVDNGASPNVSYGTGFSGTVGGIGTVNTGRAIRLQQGSDSNDVANDAWINTNQQSQALAATSGAYTMMAWVKLDSVAGDNMVFGQNNGNNSQLHNGFRNANPHQGHWGNDTTAGATVDTTSWRHIAFTFDASVGGGTQTIYLDGVQVATAGTKAAAPNPTLNLIIGQMEGNNGNYNGFLDEVKIFDTVLSQAQIQSEAASVVPEPAAVGTLGLAATGLFARRRRRSR